MPINIVLTNCCLDNLDKRYYLCVNCQVAELMKRDKIKYVKERQPNAPLPDFENKEGFLAEAYIDKMPCSTFDINVYSEVKKAFIAGWKAKSDEYSQGVINTNL